MTAAWFLVLLVILSTMGALIVARRPSNRIGWSFVAAGVALALRAFASEYAIYATLINPGSLPGGAWLAWVSNWLTVPAIYSAFAALLLLFSHRSAAVASLAAGGLDGGGLDRRGRGGQLRLSAIPIWVWRHPSGSAGAAGQIMATIGSLAWLLVALAIPAAAASLVVRFRRSRGRGCSGSSG